MRVLQRCDVQQVRARLVLGQNHLAHLVPDLNAEFLEKLKELACLHVELNLQVQLYVKAKLFLVSHALPF